MSESENRSSLERSFSARLLEAQDNERRRISRELHDSVGQLLAALTMKLEKLTTKIAPAELDELVEAKKMVDDILAEVRTVSLLLHPPTLDLIGLRASVVSYAESFEKRTGIRTALEIPDELPKFDTQTETALFRIVQESLTNVHRHSQASDVVIRVSVNSDEFRMELNDDGVGFPVGFQEGVGIRGMRERLKELKGKLTMAPIEPGSSIVATIPLAKVIATTARLS
jgi:signal transduction histidine kinase